MMTFGMLLVLTCAAYAVIVSIFDLDTVGLPDNIMVVVATIGTFIMLYCLLTGHPSVFIR